MRVEWEIKKEQKRKRFSIYLLKRGSSKVFVRAVPGASKSALERLAREELDKQELKARRAIALSQPHVDGRLRDPYKNPKPGDLLQSSRYNESDLMGRRLVLKVKDRLVTYRFWKFMGDIEERTLPIEDWEGWCLRSKARKLGKGDVDVEVNDEGLARRTLAGGYMGK
jgi:hypothetical protein